jgi:hypothetical protein
VWTLCGLSLMTAPDGVRPCGNFRYLWQRVPGAVSKIGGLTSSPASSFATKLLVIRGHEATCGLLLVLSHIRPLSNG